MIMDNNTTVNRRRLVIKADMKPQDVINSKEATAQQKKMALVFDSDGVAGYSQREADVFNATIIADHGKNGISLWTRYKDGSKKETKYAGDIASFKFAPKCDVKPYIVAKGNEISTQTTPVLNRNTNISNNSNIYDKDGISLRFPSSAARNEYAKITGLACKERDIAIANAYKERESVRAIAWKEREYTRSKAWTDFKNGKISRDKMRQLQDAAEIKMIRMQDAAEVKMRQLQAAAFIRCTEIQTQARKRLGAVEI